MQPPQDDEMASKVKAFVANLFQTTVAALINANMNTFAAMHEQFDTVKKMEKDAATLEVVRGA